MAEDFYNDSPEPSPSADVAVESEAENEDSNVALLPKSFFPGDKDLKPGSTCKVRVEEVQEDQVLVSYQREEESEPEVAPAPAMPPPDMEMAQYMG